MLIAVQMFVPASFQPTLPARGATRGRRGIPPRPRHFNPRSPHGERRVRLHRWRRTHKPISTHAPRTGSDRVRDAPTRAVVISTHAPRTGSDVECIYRHWLAHISTHAPRTGSDTRIRARRKSPRFQPTLPARGATQPTRTAASGRPISTHAPRTGSDDGSARYWVQLPISTHAPRTGSDVVSQYSSSHFCTFQPTLPARGATPSGGQSHRRSSRFQPTLPARGATAASPGGHPRRAISTHAPRTGSDAIRRCCIYIYCYFNPRSPHGERPWWCATYCMG